MPDAAVTVLHVACLAGRQSPNSAAGLLVELTTAVQTGCTAAPAPPPSSAEARQPGHGWDGAATVIFANSHRSFSFALHSVAAGCAQDAIRALESWLTAADTIARHRGNPCALATGGILPRQSAGLGTLARLAKDAPAKLAQVLVPFVVRQAHAGALAAGATLPGHAANAMAADLVWLSGRPQTGLSLKDEILAAARTALATTSAGQPELAKGLIKALTGTGLLTTHQTAATAFAVAHPDLFDDALVWARDPRTRYLHYGTPPHSPWAKVLAHVIKDGSPQQRQDAEQLLRDASPDTAQADGDGEQDAEQLARNRREESIALSTLAHHLGQDMPQEFAAKLAGLGEPLTYSHETAHPVVVSSPIVRAVADTYTDDEWIAAIEAANSDTVSFDANTGGLHGGATYAARILGQATSADPKRFAALAPRLAPPIHPAYPRAVLTALVEPAVNADEQTAAAMLDAVLAVDKWPAAPHRAELCQIVRSRADNPLPDDVIAVVARIVEQGTDPTAANQGAPDDIVSTAFATVHGFALDTLATLLRTADIQPTRAGASLDALRAAVRDPNDEVRVLAPEALRWLLPLDATSTVELTRTWLEYANGATLLAPGLPYLAFGLLEAAPDLAREIVIRMLTADHPAVTHNAGQLAAAIACRAITAQRQAIEPADATLMREALKSTGSRIGAAAYLGSNVTTLRDDLDNAGSLDDQHREITPGWTLLLNLLDNPDVEVHAAAAGTIGAAINADPQPGRDLANLYPRIADCIGFRQQGEPILRAIAWRRGPVPAAAVTLCRTWIDHHAVQMKYYGTSARAAAPHITTITLRLRDQTEDAAAKAECLDILDKLFELDIDEAGQAAEEWDFTGLNGSESEPTP